jgi:CRISPR-associated protein Csx17
VAEFDLRLTGCRSRPLLGYLKALGVLRAVARQSDPRARGRWTGDAFELRSTLGVEELELFMLERYTPTPIVSPWNGGSGFFPKDDARAIEAIESDDSERLAPFRAAVASARATLAELGIDDKPDPKEQKPRLLRALRGALPDVALEWLDAAVVVLGEEQTHFPPLLGSGGNDGRYDFSNNYAQAVVRAMGLGKDSPEASRVWLRAALHGASAPLVKGMSLAHLSRDVSPTNSPQGEADALGNPWELILALEGSVTLTAGAARRHGSALQGAMVAPFTAVTTGAGYGSAIAHEKGRAELWLPLWPRWASLSEFETVARESRAQVGRRQARDGLDFVRAAGELGVSRGIESFERYAILERAGQSSLAVPAGRIDVRERPAVAALRSIDPWLERFRRYARGDCPAAHAEAARRLDRALFAFADSGLPEHAGRVIEELGAVESALATAGRRVDEHIRPLARVPAEQWLEAAGDGSAELAAAAAIASLRDRTPSLPAVRDYLHGTGRNSSGARTYADGRAWVPRRGDATARLAAMHARRHLDAEKADRSLPFDRGLTVPAWLASSLATGDADAERVVRLAGGLALLDFGAVPRVPVGARVSEVDPAFGLLALAWSGIPGVELEPRPRWVARLATGQTATRDAVIREAVLRLRLAELPPLVTPDDVTVSAPDGIRLAAALLLRIHDRDRRLLASRLLGVEHQSSIEGATT